MTWLPGHSDPASYYAKVRRERSRDTGRFGEYRPPYLCRRCRARGEPGLFDLAEVLVGLGKHDESAEIFRRAYLLGPSSAPFVDILRAEPGPAGARKVIDRTRALVERGVIFVPVIGYMAISEGILDNVDAVNRLIDYERYLQCDKICLPSNGEVEFNANLALEIKSTLQYYASRPERAIHRAWRHNGITQSDSPTCQEFTRLILSEIRKYIEKLSLESAHPFIRSRPREIRVEGWAVVSNRESYHNSHIHPAPG